VVNREIKNLEDAINWVRDGKPLDQVPHQYWREAVSANASKSKRDKNKRFKSVAKNGGNIGDTEIYVLRDSDGFATNHGLVFKSSRAGDNIGEIVGWNYLDRLGIIEGGAVYDGPGNDGAYVMFHFAFKDIPEGNAIGKADGGDNFVYAQRKADELQGFPGRVHNWLANYILGVSDRHDGNGMMREVAHEGGKKVVVIPLDLGWAGRGVENDPLQYLRFFGMDGALMSDMATAYQRATPEGKRRILYDLERALDNIITKTENMLDVNKADFVKQAIKNVPSGEKATAEKKAEKLYDQMKKQLQNLKDSKQAIIDRVRS
jgi:hypothetical protein